MQEHVRVTVDRDTLAVGGSLRARMSWQHPKVPQGVRLELGWETEGRGDTDRAVVQRHAVGPEHGQIPSHLEAVLTVPPDAPVSYDGQLIRVRWWVRGVVDLRLARDPVDEVAVLVTPAVVPG